MSFFNACVYQVICSHNLSLIANIISRLCFGVFRIHVDIEFGVQFVNLLPGAAWLLSPIRN